MYDTYPTASLCVIIPICPIILVYAVRMAFNHGAVADPKLIPARDNYAAEDVKAIPGLEPLPAGYTDFLRRLLLRGKPIADSEGFEASIIHVAYGRSPHGRSSVS